MDIDKMYNNIASKGRGGDSELRSVFGEVSHVNPIEVNLIDSLGRSGEEIVNQIGSGTINPETGLREYNIRKGPLGKAWNVTFGKYGIGGLFSGGAARKADALRAQAGGAVSSGLADLESYGQDYLGEGGILAEEKTSKVGSLGASTRGEISKIGDYKDKIAMKGNMATGGDFTSVIEKNLMDAYNRNLGDINLESQKTQIDFIADLKKQKTQLLMDYTSATGGSYGGSADNSFDDFISQYS